MPITDEQLRSAARTVAEYEKRDPKSLSKEETAAYVTAMMVLDKASEK